MWSQLVHIPLITVGTHQIVMHTAASSIIIVFFKRRVIVLNVKESHDVLRVQFP